MTPPDPRHSTVRGAAWAALALVAGCGGADEPTTPEATEMVGRRSEPPGATRHGAVARASEAPPPPAAGDSNSRLFETRRQTHPDWKADNIRRRDPAQDGWRSEVLHDLAKTALKDLLHEFVHPSGDGFEAYLADSFAGSTELRPSELETVFDDGALRTLRPAALAPDAPLLARDQLASVVADAMEPFAGAAELDAAFKIIKVDAEGERFETIAKIEIDGVLDGSPIQQNSEWSLGWVAADDDGRALVEWIRLRSYEEVRTSRGLLGELTGYVFGDNEFWDEEFRLGISDYYFKVDKLTGNAFIGGQGLAVGDVNGDGLDDVYVCQQGGLPNRLFLHRKNGVAVDVAERAQVAFLDNTRGALIVDLDQDGNQDLALAMKDNVIVCFGNGDGRFPARMKLEGKGEQDIFSLTAADADLDGDLDLYGCRYVKNGVLGGVPTPYHDADNGSPNLFFRNDGERVFTSAAREAGLMQNNTKFSLASIWEDFDDDGDPDLYVTNDFGRNNLYINFLEQGGRFRDRAIEAGADDMAAGMGASSADVDLDGHPDILVTNMFSSAGLRIASLPAEFMSGRNRDVHEHYVHHARGNTLLCNRGDGTFEDVTETAGVAIGRWGWGALFVELNNDGLEDMYVPNGFITNKDPADM